LVLGLSWGAEPNEVRLISVQFKAVQRLPAVDVIDADKFGSRTNDLEQWMDTPSI